MAFIYTLPKSINPYLSLTKYRADSKLRKMDKLTYRERLKKREKRIADINQKRNTLYELVYKNVG